MNKFHDRSNEGKGYKIKPEDAKVIAEQQRLGKLMDEYKKKEMFLGRHKQEFNADDSLLLYRLPLNESQIENMYYKLINEKVSQ